MSAPILLNLGDYQFSMDTAAFEELQRSSAYSWAELPRLGVNPSLQFTGVEAEVITLNGKIFPHFRGGLGQIDEMRAQAAKGKPLLLVDGLGSIKGFWCITRVEEGRRHLWSSGAPRLQEFTIELKCYGPNGNDTAPRAHTAITAPVGSPTPGRFVRTAAKAPDRVTPAPGKTIPAPTTPTRFPHNGRYPFGTVNIPFIGPVALPLPNVSMPVHLPGVIKTPAGPVRIPNVQPDMPF